MASSLGLSFVRRPVGTALAHFFPPHCEPPHTRLGGKSCLKAGRRNDRRKGLQCTSCGSPWRPQSPCRSWSAFYCSEYDCTATSRSILICENNPAVAGSHAAPSVRGPSGRSTDHLPISFSAEGASSRSALRSMQTWGRPLADRRAGPGTDAATSKRSHKWCTLGRAALGETLWRNAMIEGRKQWTRSAGISLWYSQLRSLL